MNFHSGFIYTRKLWPQNTEENKTTKKKAPTRTSRDDETKFINDSLLKKDEITTTLPKLEINGLELEKGKTMTPAVHTDRTLFALPYYC